LSGILSLEKKPKDEDPKKKKSRRRIGAASSTFFLRAGYPRKGSSPLTKPFPAAACAEGQEKTPECRKSTQAFGFLWPGRLGHQGEEPNPKALGSPEAGVACILLPLGIGRRAVALIPRPSGGSKMQPKQKRAETLFHRCRPPRAIADRGVFL
jgi:hypothetical protein